MKRLVFIDRDGIINVDPIGDYVKTWEEFKFEEGAIDALRKIYESGFHIIIISNQAGVGDGVYTEENLWDIHHKMLEALRKNRVQIFDAQYCLHGKQAGCSCRKPQTGLFERATDGIPFDRRRTYFIGDKATDIEAGKRFGLKTIFVLTGHGRHDLPKLKGELRPDHIVINLGEAVRVLSS